MAEKDLSCKKIEDYNDVFADIYNTLLFGKDYINPKRLEAGPTESIYKTDEKNLNEQRRDVLKKYQNMTNLLVSSFGIENQAKIDKFMPVRIMGYDFGSYHQQINDEVENLAPVITIVLNMTDKKWNKAKSIYEMFDIDKIDEELAEHVQDYKIHVFDIAFLDDTVIDRFKSDFKEIANFFKKKRLGENPLTSENELKHPHAIMEFISVFTQDRSYLDSLNFIEKDTGGAVTMCAVADALKTEGRQEGRLEGRQEGRLEGAVEILIAAKFSEDKITDMVMEQFNMPRVEAEKAIQKIKGKR